MSKFSETTGEICFWTETPVSSLYELIEYIDAHATAAPIGGDELANAKVLDVDDLDIDEDELPETNEFTPAEARFMRLIIEQAIANPENSAGYINMEFDEADPELTIIEIQFPPYLEAPAELR